MAAGVLHPSRKIIGRGLAIAASLVINRPTLYDLIKAYGLLGTAG